MKKETIIPIVVILAILAIVMVPVLIGANKIEDAKVACEAKGGVQVRTMDGVACIKGQKVE